METSPAIQPLDPRETAFDDAGICVDFGASLAGLADCAQADWLPADLMPEPPEDAPLGESDYSLPTVTPAAIAGLRGVLRSFSKLLQVGQVPASPKTARLLIQDLESLIATASGMQMQAIDIYDRLTRANNAANGIVARDQGRGVKRAIAMATHSSPSRADKLVSTAKLLTHELPCTFRALCSGRISFYRAEIIATEAHKLPTTQRRRLFDERLAGDISRIETMGIRTLRRAAQSLVDEVHPVSAVERFAAEAKASSQVSVEEIGCGMSRLIATMPTPHAAHIYSVLAAVADKAVPARPASIDRKTGQVWNIPWGDPGLYHENDVARGERESRGQIMTTTLFNMFATPMPQPNRVVEPVETPELARQVVEPVAAPRVVEPVETTQTRLLGIIELDPVTISNSDPDEVASVGVRAPASKTKAVSPSAPIRVAPIPITIDLVISDRTLLGYGEEPAIILADSGRKNVGTVPAAIARAIAATSIEAGVTWLRKIYVNDTGNLTATSSRQRFFPDGLATLLRLRDQGICRTPWCDAPIRHSDHVIPWCQGGETCLENGAGLCVRCNQDKEAPGWKTTVNINPETGQQEITYTEPTGQTHKSTPPKLPKPAEQ